MEIEIKRSPGWRNDLLITIPRAEVEDTWFSLVSRDELRGLPGLVRHLHQMDPATREALQRCKKPLPDHVSLLQQAGAHLLDERGRPGRPFLVIGCRNVGNNHGFVVWQAEREPRLFHVLDDPCGYPSYSCLTRLHDRTLGVRQLRFERERVIEGQTDITEQVAWSVYANWILRRGKVVAIEELIEEFYDIRHVLAFDRVTPAGQRIEEHIYGGYPAAFRDRALSALRELRVPRSRYLHNCLGLSENRLFILQREGTVEELAHWLQEAGAEDGLILDNGASVFCWASWIHPNGGYIFAAPDHRPNATAVLAFTLNGPLRCDLPGGSVSYAVL